MGAIVFECMWSQAIGTLDGYATFDHQLSNEYEAFFFFANKT